MDHSKNGGYEFVITTLDTLRDDSLSSEKKDTLRNIYYCDLPLFHVP